MQFVSAVVISPRNLAVTVVYADIFEAAPFSLTHVDAVIAMDMEIIAIL
jgi:hypothetical protein